MHPKYKTAPKIWQFVMPRTLILPLSDVKPLPYPFITKMCLSGSLSLMSFDPIISPLSSLWQDILLLHKSSSHLMLSREPLATSNDWETIYG